MTDLGRKMARGAAWLVMFRLLERGIGFVSTLILARILVPADFGLVAMATSILAALELLGAFSFDLALIQNQKAERRHYDTAWTFGVVFGLVKALGMCALAVPAAAFFDEPRVTAVMLVLALGTAIQGFENIGIVAFQKDLELHKEFRMGLIKKLAGFFVTLALALWLRSHWALVAGVLAMRVTSLVLSFTMHPFRPRLGWGGAAELFNYSKWLLLNNLLIFLNNRGTDFIIGRTSGAQALGLYSVAYEVANLPTTELVFPISRAVYPGYAKLANDVGQLRSAFFKVIGLLAILTVPAGALIGVVADPLVRVLLGAKWIDTVPLIEVLAMFGIVRALHGPTGTIYLAVGKPRVIAMLQAAQLSVALGSMAWTLPAWGIIGAAWSLLFGALTAMTINYILALRELQATFGQLAAVFWRPLAGAAAAALVVMQLAPLCATVPFLNVALVKLLLLTVAGLLTYGAVVALGWRLQGRPVGAESELLQFVSQRMTRPRPST